MQQLTVQGQEQTDTLGPDLLTPLLAPWGASLAHMYHPGKPHCTRRTWRNLCCRGLNSHALDSGTSSRIMPFAVLAVNDTACKIDQDRAVSLDNHKDLHHVTF